MSKLAIVLSRHAATKIKALNRDHIWISITDPGSDDAELHIGEKCKGILRLKFWDIIKPVDDYSPISQAQVEELVNFISNHKDTDTFLIHCEAGISRSAAVAEVLRIAFGFSVKSVRDFAMPNPYVKSELLKQLGYYSSETSVNF